MGIAEDLDLALREAMKARDLTTADALRGAKTALSYKAAEPGFHGPMDDMAARQVLSAHVRRLQKALAEYEGIGERGAGHAARIRQEIGTVSRFLPAPAAAGEVDAFVRAAIAETGATGPADIGRVMKAVMTARKGQVEGAAVRAAAERLLSPGTDPS